MNIEQDPQSDSMYLHIHGEKQISHSVEFYPDTIILDVAEDGTVVGIECRSVSTWLTEHREPVGPTATTGELVYKVPA